MNARPLVAVVLLVLAALVGALGAFVYATERGVANDIKGFVLILIAAVLAIGGGVLWELRAIRNALERKNQA